MRMRGTALDFRLEGKTWFSERGKYKTQR